MKASEYQHQADRNTPPKAAVIVSARVHSYYVLWSAKPGLVPGVGIGGQMGLLQGKPNHRPGEDNRTRWQKGDGKEPTACSRVALASEKSRHETVSTQQAAGIWVHQGSQSIESVHGTRQASMSGTYLSSPGPQPLIWVFRFISRLSGGRLMWSS